MLTYCKTNQPTNQPNFSLDKKKTHNYMSRCPWCNGYRGRKWTWWHEFKSWPRLTAFHIALIPLGKVWIQLFSLQLWVNSRQITPMTHSFWQMLPPKPKPCNVVWNEQLQALASKLMHTTEYMCFNQTGDISTLNGSSLKLVEKVQQCLINRDRHQYMTSKGMDSHRLAIVQTWPIKWNAVFSRQRLCRYCYMDALHGR